MPHSARAPGATRFWLMADGGGASGPAAQPGVVMERTASGQFITRPFAFGQSQFLYPQLTARSDRCLVTSHNYFESRAVGVRTATVDAAGVVSATREMELPTDSFWVGGMPYQNGFFGIWTVTYPNQQQIIYGREMTPEGAWVAGSSAVVVAPIPATGLVPWLIPGPEASILNLQDHAYLLRPLQPLSQIQTHNFQTIIYALSAARILSLSTDTVGRIQGSRRTLEAPWQADHTAFLTEDPGRASDPSLAWSPRGPQVVFQMEGYGSSNGQAITGGNKLANSQSGAQFLTEKFSSPSQAWVGRVQCIAYRRARTPETSDPDDVYGVINTLADDGTLTMTRAPFLIAGGPGSQRAVSVAPYYYSNGPGFLAVWREEEGSTSDGSYISEIRAANININGEVSPPGGRLVDISVGELSAPATSLSGAVVYRVPQLPDSERTMIRFAGVSVPQGVIGYRNVSPPEHDAVNPQVWNNGSSSYSLVAWRDKITRRIYVYQQGGNFPAGVIPVSPAGQRALEPRLASLAYSKALAVWIQDQVYPAAALDGDRGTGCRERSGAVDGRLVRQGNTGCEW